MNADKKPKILIVDDDENLRVAIADCLEIEDFEILSASGGHEALELIKQNPNIDFVLSDIRMPAGGGLWLLKEVKKINSKKPPVCLMTGFAEASKEQVIEWGGIDLLSKPIDVDSVINMIRLFV